MCEFLRSFTAFALALFLCGPCCEGGWKAGAAAVKITPRQPMWMSGYASRTKPAEGTLIDLYIKALLIDDGQSKPVLLLTFDLIGLDRELSAEIKQLITAETGIPAENIALCCSHTHTGPVVHNNLRAMYLTALDDAEWGRITAYAEFLKARVVELVQLAVKDLQPAELSWAQSKADFAVNRRNNPEPEVPALRAAGTLKGPVDHDVPVLQVIRNGQLRAVAFGYACHATVLSSFEWSGDYPGFAQLEVEKKHPGCVAMFWAGCGGDQNPLPRREVALAKEYGGKLAEAVEAGLNSPQTSIMGSVRTAAVTVPLPFASMPSRESLEKLAAEDTGYEGRRARALLEEIQKKGDLSPTYPYPIQAWKLGNAPTWLFLGGEVVVDYSLRLKQKLGGSSIWIAAYTNDVMAYIPSKRVLEEGGYEGGGAMVYYGLPSAWDATVEERIIKEATDLATQVAR
jgi:hypothetical protein